MLKILRMSAVVAAVLLAAPSAAGASLPFADLADTRGPFEWTGASGDAMYVCKLGDAGGWPVCAYWSSARTERSPLFGMGWSIPALESRFVPLDERRWAFHQPDGFVRIFVRAARDTPDVLTGGSAWTATVKGDSIRVTADPRDGGPKSEFTFRQGRLVRMSCEEGDFEIKYSGRTADKIVSRGKPLLEVVRESGPDERIVLRFDGGRSRVVAVCRQSTVFGPQGESSAVMPSLEKCLKSLQFSDGRALEFDYIGEGDDAFFSVDGERVAWNPRTRRIVSCGGWRYDIEDAKDELNEPSFARHHSDGRSEESSFDRKNGLYTRRYADGRSWTSKVFTSGPLAYRRTRWTKETGKDGASVRTDFTYDEAGRVIYRRVVRDGEQGGTDETWFDASGAAIRRRIDGEEVKVR